MRGANNLLIKELYTVLGDSILSGNPRLPERQLTRLKEVRDCRDVTAALVDVEAASPERVVAFSEQLNVRMATLFIGAERAWYKLFKQARSDER